MAFYGTSTRRLLAFFSFGFLAVGLGMGALSVTPEIDDEKRMVLHVFVGVFVFLALVALIGALRTSAVDVTLLPAPPETPADSLNNRKKYRGTGLLSTLPSLSKSASIGVNRW